MKHFLAALALVLTATAAAAAAPELQGRALSETAAVLSWTAGDCPVGLEVRWSRRPWEPIATLPAKATGIYVVELEPGTTYFFRLHLTGRTYSNAVALTAHFAPGEPCIEGEGVACYEGRYRVTNAYQGGGRILIVVTDTTTGRTSTYLDGRRHR